MKCLSEDQLAALYYGDGNAAEQAHRTACMDCARRYRRLEDELQRIAAALESPAPATTARTAAFPARWATMAAAALVLLALVWGLPTERQSAPGPAASGTGRTELHAGASDMEDDSLYTAVEELFAGSSETTRLRADALTNDEQQFAYLQAALDGGFPCFWSDPLYSSGCDETELVSIF